MKTFSISSRIFNKKSIFNPKSGMCIFNVKLISIKNRYRLEDSENKLVVITRDRYCGKDQIGERD